MAIYYREKPLSMPPYAIELAMYTGMRVSELSTLKWSDINDICISINKSAKQNRLKNEFSVGKTKTKKSRAYPVDGQTNHLLARIKRVQEEHGILCEWIFTDGNGSYTYDTSNLAEKKKIIQERNAKFKNLAHTG